MTLSAPLAPPLPPTTHDLLATARQLHDGRSWSPEEAGCRAALLRAPGDARAMHRLGLMALDQRQDAEALAWLRAADAARPGQVAVQCDLARALRLAGLHEEAAHHLDCAARLSPNDADLQLKARLQRGVMHDEAGRAQQALECYQEAVEHHPESADAWAALGVVQRHLLGAEAATPSFQRALQIDPGRLDVMEMFGDALQEQRRFEDASLVFERLLQLQPDRPLVAGRLMHAKMLGGDWTALDRLQQRIESHLTAGAPSAEPFGLQGWCAEPELLLKAAQLHSARLHPDRSRLLPPARVGDGAKIRIGYVSGEFRNQATSVLLTEVLELHDRERFELVCFDNGWDDRSALRQRIDACASVVPIRRLEHLDAAASVRERGIDILVNLNGHFGLARPQLFALRPAPIQVNYLGFPGTIGAPYIDYLLADKIVIPPADHRHYIEQVVTLPDSYQPNDRQRRVADEPSQRAQIGLPEGAFVFCCMNNVYKITPVIFDIWMRLLNRVPASVLMLYSDAQEARDNLRHEAQARGVAGERIVFGEPLAHEQHLARLRLCDLFLDTWPYNAHTTGSDALWAGLPVLTCTGRTFASRVGSSLLHAVGLRELVTESFADYESLALSLAMDPQRLSGLRTRLAQQLNTAPLYDTPRYTRHLEAAYTQMVERYRAGLPPSAFAVETGR